MSRPPFIFSTADLEVRCHGCAHVFEVVAEEADLSDDGTTYTVPAEMRCSCPWCGRVHSAGLELTVYDPPEMR